MVYDRRNLMRLPCSFCIWNGKISSYGGTVKVFMKKACIYAGFKFSYYLKELLFEKGAKQNGGWNKHYNL
ncbi:MAG: hypothetical protein HFG79_04725 [Lachnospiraceae bacterium]|nr:hypothetical protein [Lachnospiraceae bacterium]